MQTRLHQLRKPNDATTGRRRPRATMVAAALVGLLALAAAIGWGATPKVDNQGAADGRSTSHRKLATGQSPTTTAPGSLDTPEQRPDVAAQYAIGDDSLAAPEAPKGGAAAESAAPTERTPTIGPKEVKTGSVDLTVDTKAVEAGLIKIRSLVEGSGGTVAQLQRSSDDGDTTASLTLRIPADKFSDVMGKIEELGKVTSSQVSSSDVTQQSIDIDARLRTVTAEIDALQGILREAKTVQDMLAVRQQLNALQTELETLRAQKETLDQQVAYSTLNVTVTTPGTAVRPVPQGFWATVGSRALERIQTVTAAIFVGLANLLPLIVLALVGVLAWKTLRRRNRTSPAPVAPAKDASAA